MSPGVRIAVAPRTPAPALLLGGAAAAAATVYLTLQSPSLAFIPAACAAAAYAVVRIGPLALLLGGVIVLLGVDVRILEGSGFMSFSVAEVALLSGLAFYLLRALRDRAPIAAPAHAPLMIALVLYMIFSNLFADGVAHYLSETRNWLMAFLLMFLLGNVFGGTGDRVQMIVLFIVTCDAFAALGLLQSLAGVQAFNAATSMEYKRGFVDALAGGAGEQVSAAVGLTAHSNGLGRLLAMALPLAALMALGGAGPRTKGVRALCAASIPLMGVCLFLTYSKGAIVTCLVTLLLLYAVLRVRVRVSTILAILAVVTAAAAALYVALDQLGYTGLIETTTYRLELWRDVFVTLARHPIVAVFGNGQELYGGIALYDQPHNTYLFLLIQHGAVSTAMIFLLVGLYVVDLDRARGPAGGAHGALAGAALASVFGFLTGELVESGLMGVTMKMLFFFLFYLGLPWKGEDTAPQVHAPGSTSDG